MFNRRLPDNVCYTDQIEPDSYRVAKIHKFKASLDMLVHVFYFVPRLWLRRPDRCRDAGAKSLTGSIKNYITLCN